MEYKKMSIWPEGYFVKYQNNPILWSQGVGFEAKAVFNPAAIVRNDTIFLLYRAEDWQGVRRWNGTSTIGLAFSTDGINFKRRMKPVITPEFDYETPGGCEDPRIVQIGETYYLTYTAYDGENARLSLATSSDLLNWEKAGPMISGNWSKAGAILPEKINNRYVMYFGDHHIYVAYSDNLIDWDIADEPVLYPREGYFDERIVEPGPPPLLTEKGILLIYNGSNKQGHYETGWVLFSQENPAELIARSEKPFLNISEDIERNGQVPNVIFTEGLVHYKNMWYLYYGASDTYIGVAIGIAVFGAVGRVFGIQAVLLFPIVRHAVVIGIGRRCGGFQLGPAAHIRLIIDDSARPFYDIFDDADVNRISLRQDRADASQNTPVRRRSVVRVHGRDSDWSILLVCPDLFGGKTPE